MPGLKKDPSAIHRGVFLQTYGCWGMSYKEIGQALHVSPSLARKADRFGRK